MMSCRHSVDHHNDSTSARLEGGRGNLVGYDTVPTQPGTLLVPLHRYHTRVSHLPNADARPVARAQAPRWQARER